MSRPQLIAALSLALLASPGAPTNAWCAEGRSFAAGPRREPTAAELSGARKKFQRALALQTGGDWAGALSLLKDVAEVKSTPQVRFNIALCEENLGQLVAALGDYELAATDAADLGVPHVEAEATQRLEQVRARIPTIRLQRRGAALRSTVSLDGVELGEAALAQSLPVDPGQHVIRAETEGHLPFETVVQVNERQRTTVTIELTPSEVDPTSGTPAQQGSTRRTWMYVSGGIGLAALGASGVFYLLRANAIDELDSRCPTRQMCPADSREVRDRGVTYQTVANVTLGVGALGLGTAAVLWLTDPAQDSDSVEAHLPTDATWRVTPNALGADAGLSVVGAF